MAWNGVGTYVLPPAYSPEVNGTVIDAVRYNGLTSDVATGLTQAINKNGENTPAADISWGNWKLKSLATATTTGDALSFGRAATVGILTVDSPDVYGSWSGNNAANSFWSMKTAGVTYGYFGRSEAISGNVSGAGWRSETYAQICTGGGTQRLRVMATGPVVLGSGTTNVGIGSGADLLAVPGTIGFTTQLNGLPGPGNPLQIINRSTGGMQLFVDAAGTLAADFDVAGNLSMSGDVDIDGVVTANGVGLTAVKAAITTRNNTSVLAADPDLVVALPTGWFDIEVFLPITIGVGGGGDGFKYNFTTSGTIANDTQASYGLNKALASQGGQDFTTGGSCAAMSSGSTEWFMVKGTCQVTVAGSLTFQWAQLSAGAHNTSIRAGGFMKCTKLA